MESGGQPGSPARDGGHLAEAHTIQRSAGSRRPLSAVDVQLYRLCEDVTEALIYAMVVFGPWAFGTTQPWSIWLMNGAGFLLGLMLACKMAIRRLKGYCPPRWDDAQRESPGHSAGAALLNAPRLTASLAWLSAAILVYCLVSALNAGATFQREAMSFAPHKYIKWLPHSFDSGRTWVAFWTCLGLALSFWALRDWLAGKADSEHRSHRPKAEGGAGPPAPLLPARLRRLLWVLAINGALLAVEGIAQRLQGAGKLLFLVQPRVNPGADSQFGPYAYRANASQYFNLLWPGCLGFWWMLNRSSGQGRNAHHVILAGCAIMAACPIISTSRAGAAVTVAIVVLAALGLAAAHLFLGAHQEQAKGRTSRTLGWLVLFFGGSLVLGFALGWKTLKPRMAQLGEGFEIREAMYEAARPMSRDYPVFGTGPGTFESVFQLYRTSTDTYWPAQLHNDWLETLITFGWTGSALIALAFIAVVLRWFGRGGIHGGRRFVMLIWLALGGCLFHARYDFPFQVHSIIFLFLVLCAILSVLTRRR